MEDFIMTKQLGPLTNVLKYLNEEDLKNLSFVTSDTRMKMMENYEEFKLLKMMGRKIESKIFEHKYLTFCESISEINQFIDAIHVPVNELSEKERLYIKTIELPFLSRFDDNDLFNIQFGLERGEKLDKSLVNVIFIKSRFVMIYFIEFLLEIYQDELFVIKMLPMKTIALVISMDDHYCRLLQLYKMFGENFILNLLDYLDVKKFFQNFMKSTIIYSSAVENLTEIDEHIEWYNETPSYGPSLEHMEEVYREGEDLMDLISLFCREHPVIMEIQTKYNVNYSSEEKELDFETMTRFIDISMYDIKSCIECRK
jgi:hypothetical protein